MLHTHVVRRIRAPFTECLKCVLDPKLVIGSSPYTYSIKEIGENTYEVVFKWRKLGVTRYYPVRIKIVHGKDTVVYESTEDSEYWFRMVFKLKDGGSETILEVDASMKAGFAAELLGRRDYAKFVEQLVDRGIGAFLEKLSKETTSMKREAGKAENMSCKTCSLFDEERSFCYYLQKIIKDPENPECGGKAYMSLLASRGASS